ncbi:MAG: hypothetical protein ACYSOL_04695, partial [Planctomycetota bacterium]
VLAQIPYKPWHKNIYFPLEIPGKDGTRSAHKKTARFCKRAGFHWRRVMKSLFNRTPIVTRFEYGSSGKYFVYLL